MEIGGAVLVSGEMCWWRGRVDAYGRVGAPNVKVSNIYRDNRLWAPRPDARSQNLLSLCIYFPILCTALLSGAIWHLVVCVSWGSWRAEDEGYSLAGMWRCRWCVKVCTPTQPASTRGADSYPRLAHTSPAPLPSSPTPYTSHPYTCLTGPSHLTHTYSILLRCTSFSQ